MGIDSSEHTSHTPTDKQRKTNNRKRKCNHTKHPTNTINKTRYLSYINKQQTSTHRYNHPRKSNTHITRSNIWWIKKTLCSRSVVRPIIKPSRGLDPGSNPGGSTSFINIIFLRKKILFESMHYIH